MTIQRRIFKIPQTPHFDHWILEIDGEFVHLRRLLFGLQRGVITRGHQFLKKKYPNYLDLPFEQWAEFDSNEMSASDVRESHPDPEVQRVLDRFRQRLAEQPKNFFHNIHDAIRGSEDLTGEAVLHPVFGVLVKDEYGNYQTERFSPALKNIVRISFEQDDINLEQAAERYTLLEKIFPAHLSDVWPLLHKRFEEVKEDADFPEDYFPEINQDEDVEQMISMTDLTLGSSGYRINGTCTWDEEHGFELSIDPEFQVELNH